MVVTFEYKYGKFITIIDHLNNYVQIQAGILLRWFKTGNIHDVNLACLNPYIPANAEEIVRECLFGPCTCNLAPDEQLVEAFKYTGVRIDEHTNWQECLALQVVRYYVSCQPEPPIMSIYNKETVQNALLLASLGYKKLLTHLITAVEQSDEVFLELYDVLDSSHSSRNVLATLLFARDIYKH